VKVATIADRPGLLSGPSLAITYLTTWSCSVGTTLLTIGLFFYTAHEFQWGAGRNMGLATGQGAAYTLGALLAHQVRARFGVRRSLLTLYLLMALLAGLAPLMSAHWIVALMLLAYAFVAAVNWPMLESLVTAGTDARQMSRRVGTYNVVWASAGAAAVASAGWIIAHRPSALFFVAVATHLFAALLILMLRQHELNDAESSSSSSVAEVEPELLHARTLALWLSRIALPASYVVNYSLSALLPSLFVLQSLGATTQTLLGSAWLVSRWLTFWMLARATFWHTRPRILLAAAVAMLAAFLCVCLPPSQVLWRDISWRADVSVMIVAQVVLGASMGIIYAGSLYFGMVLSDGSTEHGGYHEALIGLGSVLGPGIGAIAQLTWAGDVRRAVIAVACVVGGCVVTAGFASFALRRRE
jgi:MFS family permease